MSATEQEKEETMTNYRVHYREDYSIRDRIIGVCCLEVAQDVATSKQGQITDINGVIIPRDIPGHCLQCEVTHV